MTMNEPSLSADAIRVLRTIHERGLQQHWFHLSAHAEYDDGEWMSTKDCDIVSGELTHHYQNMRNDHPTDPGYLIEVDIHEDDDWYDSYESGIWYRYTLTDKALALIGAPTSGTPVPPEIERPADDD